MLVNCTKKHKPLSVQQVFSIEKYQGRWYEIARLPNKFEKGCRCATADYKLLKNGKVSVLNQCKRNEKLDQAKGKAWISNQAEPAKLKVSFFWPFRGDYQILYTNYKVALIGTPNRAYLWILARTPAISEAQKNKLLLMAQAQDFNTQKLHYTDQHNCEFLNGEAGDRSKQ